MLDERERELWRYAARRGAEAVFALPLFLIALFAMILTIGCLNNLVVGGGAACASFAGQFVSSLWHKLGAGVCVAVVVSCVMALIFFLA